MRVSASFNPQARIELKEAASFYGLKSETLRERFLRAFEEALEEVLAHPEATRVARGDVRRKRLHQFPYGFLYTIRAQEVRILAVTHQRRRPFYWWGRE